MPQLIDLSTENSENNDEEVLDLTDDADDETSEKTGVRAVIPAAMRWKKGLTLGSNNRPLGCVSNLTQILRLHPDTRGLLAYDSRACRAVLLKQPPWTRRDASYPDPWIDADSVNALSWLARLRPRTVASPSQVIDAIITVARDNEYDPFRRYLESLTWDGAPRLDSVLVDLFGAEDIELNRVYFQKWLISAVSRTFQPGCKADSMLILIGRQGLGKNRGIAALLPEPRYLVEGLPRGTDKDALLALQGPAVVHDDELCLTSQRSVEHLKSFLSTTVDYFRAPYERPTVGHPRRVVFVGSTNNESPLHDVSGNRRFWPVRLHGPILVDRIAELRDQLWAEAVHCYRAHEAWWLDDLETRLQVESVESYRRDDPIEGILAAKLNGADTSVLQAIELVGLPNDKVNEMRVARALTAIGYVRLGRKTIGGLGKTTYYGLDNHKLPEVVQG